MEYLLTAFLMAAATAFAAGPTDPFSISTDRAVYGKRVSQQIPAIARVGSRFFCIWYGVNFGEPGNSGEQSSCYNTLAYSDDACQTWTETTYFIPNVKVEIYVAYDHGRGRKGPDFTIAVVSEADLLAGKPAFRRIIAAK